MRFVWLSPAFWEKPGLYLKTRGSMLRLIPYPSRRP